MNIQEVKEIVGRYERYLLGLELGIPTLSLKRSLVQVSGHVAMIISGISQELDSAKTKRDEARAKELVALTVRIDKMYNGYIELGKKLGVPNMEKAQ